MKLYVTGGYKELIEEIEVTRVTDKSYWRMVDRWGKTIEERSSMQTTYSKAWKTKEDAKKYLVDRTILSIENTKNKLDKLEDKLKELNEYSL